MFEAEVPELMISFIGIENDLYLSIRCIELLNSLLLKATEEKQHRFLHVLKKNDKFFNVFFYIKIRLQ